MNQNNDQLVIKVIPIGAQVVAVHMKNHLDFSKGYVKSLDVLFTLGRCHAEYVAHDFPYQFVNLGDGSDYYRAVTSAIFEDDKGFAVSNNYAVSIFDHNTNKRLYVIVLEKGNNIVVHDLFPRAQGHGRPPETDTILVANSKIDHEKILGMQPRWAEGCTYDLAMCARMFGFTFDHLNDVVNIPKERRDNWFKACRDQLIPHEPTDKFKTTVDNL
jgi:hypothetical protein